MPLSEKQIAQLRILLGNPPQDLEDQAAQVVYGKPYAELSHAHKSWVTMRLNEFKEPEGIEQAIHTTFGLEADLQKALRANIQQLEHGLKITDGGKERQVESGFIDITAEDTQGRGVIIELKAGKADRETIGQILGYMGDVQRNSEKPVRGIIVAGDFTIHPVAALAVLPSIELKKYGFNFSFEAVAPKKK